MPWEGSAAAEGRFGVDRARGLGFGAGVAVGTGSPWPRRSGPWRARCARWMFRGGALRLDVAVRGLGRRRVVGEEEARGLHDARGDAQRARADPADAEPDGGREGADAAAAAGAQDLEAGGDVRALGPAEELSGSIAEVAEREAAGREIEGELAGQVGDARGDLVRRGRAGWCAGGGPPRRARGRGRRGCASRSGGARVARSRRCRAAGAGRSRGAGAPGRWRPRPGRAAIAAGPAASAGKQQLDPAQAGHVELADRSPGMPRSGAGGGGPRRARSSSRLPRARAASTGAKRSHSSPDSIAVYALMNRRRPSVIARFTFVYDHSHRSAISWYESPSALSSSARASSGFSARSASAERLTRSPPATSSSVERPGAAMTASTSSSSLPTVPGGSGGSPAPRASPRPAATRPRWPGRRCRSAGGRSRALAGRRPARRRGTATTGWRRASSARPCVGHDRRHALLRVRVDPDREPLLHPSCHSPSLYRAPPTHPGAGRTN